MPTGYTAAIIDGEGIEFKDFALLCAREFVAKVDFKKARDASGRPIKKGDVIDLEKMLIIGSQDPHVGDHLKEWLEENNVTQTQLSTMIGRPQKTISEIIQGKKEITPGTALDLELATKVPAEVWLRIQADHLVSKARKGYTKKLKPKPPQGERPDLTGKGKVQAHTEQIIKMRKQGAKVKNIAKELKVSEAGVYRVLRAIRADAQ